MCVYCLLTERDFSYWALFDKFNYTFFSDLKSFRSAWFYFIIESIYVRNAKIDAYGGKRVCSPEIGLNWTVFFFVYILFQLSAKPSISWCQNIVNAVLTYYYITIWQLFTKYDDDLKWLVFLPVNPATQSIHILFTENTNHKLYFKYALLLQRSFRVTYNIPW